MDDGRYHKVANVIGETMKLHPHGDAAIGDALIVLANKGYFIERQGNFGNVLTGHPAAARALHRVPADAAGHRDLFNEALTEFVAELRRPHEGAGATAAKLPVVLMLGTEGHRGRHGDQASCPTTCRSCGRRRSRSSGSETVDVFIPTSPGRADRRLGVRRRPRQGRGSGPHRGEGREASSSIREIALRHHDREPDRIRSRPRPRRAASRSPRSTTSPPTRSRSS